MMIMLFVFLVRRRYPVNPELLALWPLAQMWNPPGNIDNKTKQKKPKQASLWTNSLCMFSRLMIWFKYKKKRLHNETLLSTLRCFVLAGGSGAFFHLRRLKMLFLLELLSAVLRPMSSRAFSSSSCCCRLLSDFPSNDLLRRSEAEAGFSRSFSFIICRIGRGAETTKLVIDWQLG